MFNVSALLLDDVLLKCVVIYISRLVSIVALKTLIFHKECSDTLEMWWDI